MTKRIPYIPSRLENGLRSAYRRRGLSGLVAHVDYLARRGRFTPAALEALERLARQEHIEGDLELALRPFKPSGDPNAE